ncbi:MAG: serine--tRNA ligase [Pseudomonadota bacterium]|nr:serine--tRNA ligase [Pseudomonadota bacterium]
MLDPILVKDRLDETKAQLGVRAAKLQDEFASLKRYGAERLSIIPELETARRLRKELSAKIAAAKSAGEDVAALLKEGQTYGNEIKKQEEKLKKVEQEYRDLLLQLPNIPHASVPPGAHETDNQEISRWGDPRQFNFTPKAHWDLGPALGVLDFERAAKMSGSRFAVLFGDGARLNRALINFMLALHTREHGYTETGTPFLVKGQALLGTGNLPKFEDDLFKVVGDRNLYLIPTAEVPLANLHRDEVLDGRRLPLSYVAYTPCFRSEAGSYGKDVRGLIRQHQFEKVELFKFTTPEQSYDEHETLTRHAEMVLEKLELPYRRVILCAGDMGFAAAKTYDLEVWLPGQQGYREISSCSNTEAFQARRANIKFRPEGSGKLRFVHTLNGSGLAVGRTFIAILENGQQKDGSVVIPKVLQPFMDGQEVIEPTG